MFCGIEPKNGQYFNKVTESRDRCEFAKFIDDIAITYSSAEKITLVVDNLSTHNLKFFKTCFGAEKAAVILSQFDMFYTSKHARCLNQAEIAIGMYARKCLGNGRVGSLEHLASQTAA